MKSPFDAIQLESWCMTRPTKVPTCTTLLNAVVQVPSFRPPEAVAATVYLTHRGLRAPQVR